MSGPSATAVEEGAGVAVERAFLIADVRGYTRFTRERGDVEAARLATRFADLSRDAVEARSGRVIELRGDEVLAVFLSPGQAVRAAVELQATCAEELAADPRLPLLVGVGIDVGEAVPVGDGFRGAALNTAARLCSKALAGQVLVSAGVVDRAGEIPGVAFVSRGSVELKGFESAVELIEVVAEERALLGVRAAVSPPPIELDVDSPLVGREHELAWLRGNWRQVRRGSGRILFVSGPGQIGKSRLAAEFAAFVHANGGLVMYAGAGGGAAGALAASTLRAATEERGPTLVVLDDLEVTGDAVAPILVERWERIEGSTPTLVLGLVREPESQPPLGQLLERADRLGDGHRRLGSLNAEEVREIAGLYAGERAEEVSLESIVRASGGVPGLVHELMGEWAEQEATRRLSAAAEWLAAGRREHRVDLEYADTVIGLKLARLYRAQATAASEVTVCPYKGLASFEAEDAQLFFGRERLVGELAARTVGTGLLAVVGPSGSGKSSVIAAGLLPSLKAGLLPGSDRWRAAVIRPGEHPLPELEASIADDDGRVVLVVDQFEEAFTVCSDEGERAAFIGELVERAGKADRWAVVLSLRGDFIDSCAAYPRLAELISANQVIVGPMTQDELRRAIELPARRAGLRVERALVEALEAEVTDEPGGLPLLSTALVELWQSRSDSWLRMDAYERAGGVRGAVTRLAENGFEHLDAPEREVVRSIFLRLVASGEGDAVTRRRVLVDEFDVDRNPLTATVLNRLTEDRLLTRSEGFVEVAHEALLREWPRLRAWLEEDAQGRHLRRHVTQAAGQWLAAGRDRSELYRGARLSATVDWAALHGRELNALEREFLAESSAESERELAQQRRTNRRLKGLLTGAALLLVLAVAAGAFAFVSRSRAQQEATVALARQFAAQAVVEPRIDRAMLLARQAVTFEQSTETEGDLLSTLLRSPAALQTFALPEAVRPLAVALSPNGRVLAVSGNKADVRLFDTNAHRPLGKPIGTPGYPGAPVAFTHDGRRLVTFDGKGGWNVYDTKTQKHVFDLAPDRIQANPANCVSNQLLAPSPDDRSIVFVYAYYRSLGDGSCANTSTTNVDVWSLETGKRTAFTPLPGMHSLLAATFLTNGRLATLASNGLTAWSFPGLRKVRVEPLHLPAYAPQQANAAISPNGRTAAIGTAAGAVTFVNLRTGGRTTDPSAHSAGARVTYSPDGRTAVSIGDDRNVIVWNPATGTPLETLSGHAGRVLGSVFSGDGKTLYTCSLDGVVFAWDLSNTRRFGREFHIPLPHGQQGSPLVTIAPNSTRFAVGLGGARVGIFSTKTLVPMATITASPQRGATVVAVAWSPVTDRLAVGWAPTGATRAGKQLPPTHVDLWKLKPAPMLVRRLHGATGTVDALAWSPDGRELAATTGDASGSRSTGSVAVWDAQTGRLTTALRRRPMAGGSIAFAPDGRAIATSWDDGRVRLLSLPTGEVTQTLPTAPAGPATMAFAPNGLLYVGSNEGTIQAWNTQTGRAQGHAAQVVAAPVAGISFNPTGDTFVTSGASDGTPKLWTTDTLQQFGADFPGEPGAVLATDYAPNGHSLIVLSNTGRGWLWPTSVSGWEAHACTVAGRNLTHEEWLRFAGQRPYERTCPNHGSGS